MSGGARSGARYQVGDQVALVCNLSATLRDGMVAVVLAVRVWSPENTRYLLERAGERVWVSESCVGHKQLALPLEEAID